MGNKLQIQELVDSLTLNNHLSEDVSNNFVKTFFDTIVVALEKEQSVKIKGLGTFKLVDVDARESVDVNTGERIEIESHQKVAFTPEATLKKRINKPFEQFETVIINDGVDINSMESLNNKEVEAASLNKSSDEKNVFSDTPDDQEAESSQGVKQEDSPVKFEHTVSPMQMSLQIKKDYDEKQEKILAHEKRENRLLKIILSLLLIIILCVASYFAGYYRILCPSCRKNLEATTVSSAALPEKTSVNIDSGKKERKDSSLVAGKAIETETIAVKQVKTNLSKEKQLKEAALDKEIQSLNPDYTYRAISTRAVHKMKSGENIYHLARKYYGSADFAVYIIRYNNFEDPNLVPVGTRVKLPLLERQ